VIIPKTANERMGIQPVIDLHADGSKSVEVKVNELVKLHALIEIPNNQGYVVSVEWDLEGTGEFAEKENLSDSVNEKLMLSKSHSFSAPGTYFITIRAVSQRKGNKNTTFTRIQNLDRVRVVVS
jgi:hypothetical protein